MNDFNDQYYVMLACPSDKSEHSSIPEYQSHSINETAAANAEGIYFL